MTKALSLFFHSILVDALTTAKVLHLLQKSKHIIKKLANNTELLANFFFLPSVSAVSMSPLLLDDGFESAPNII
jgi:hypothetical protein